MTENRGGCQNVPVGREIMIQKTLSLIAAASLIFSMAGCAAQPAPAPNMVEGSGTIEFSPSSVSEENSIQPVPESPPAVSSSSTAGSVSSSSSSTKSEPQASSGSSSPASESVPSQESSSSHSQSQTQQEDDREQEKENTVPAPRDEMRAVWISYLELADLLTNQSAGQYRSKIAQACENAADLGLNTIVLQVRPFGDAIYPSEYFPQSYLFDGTEGDLNSAPFDALEIAIEEAHSRGLALEAWINPYRIRSAASAKPMSSQNPAREYLEQGGDVVIQDGSMISFNPGSKEAQDHIVNGVRELVENYDLDGIHFDDYFYPTTDASFDRDTYEASGTGKSLAEWRRSNVTTLMGKVYDVTSSAGVRFGISPQGNNSNNLNSQYVDVEEIARKGYADYICPQMYFGFQNSGCPYESTIRDFNRMLQGTGVGLYVGLATYKFGKEDTWAGAGKNEWIGTTDMIARQVEAARSLSEYGGFILYRYDSTFRPESFYGSAAITEQVRAEMENLQDILD